MSTPAPMMIDEAALRPPWDVWITVRGVPMRTRPCWEIDEGDELSGYRGWMRLPRLLVHLVRFVLLGPRPMYVHRKTLAQAFYPEDRGTIAALPNGEASLILFQYSAAEQTWSSQYQDAMLAEFMRLRRVQNPAPGAPRVREITTSEELIDSLQGVPGVRRVADGGTG